MSADMCAIARNAIQQPYLLFSPADADVVQKYFTLAAMTMSVQFVILGLCLGSEGQMKSLLTIRGNLLLINLVVIGLILWLAISFLYIAVDQRAEALQLQANVDTERTIFQASNELAKERDSFDNFLNSLDKPTAQQYQQLKTAGFESDATLDKVTTHVMHQIAELELFEYIPATRSILQMQMEDLKRQRTQLVDYRTFSLSQYLLTAETREPDFQARLFESQTDTIEVLVGLAKSLRYLPDNDAAAISKYHALLNDVLVTDVELARKYTALNKKLSGTTATSLESSVQIAVLSQKIEQRLKDIVLLAKASDNVSQLLPIAEKAERYYQQDYRQAERRIHSLAGSPGHNQISTTEWRSIKTALSNITGKLSEATHASIEVLADKHGTRATRNLTIDVFLVFLCFSITLASVVINRKIKQYAYHDGLTQLPNRLSFESTLQSASVSGSQMHAVIFIDLDKFKSINDNYGHSIGDELLMEVAARLKRTCLSAHSLARLGGDEFAVFVPNVESADDVEVLASKIVAAVKNTIVIRGLSLKVGASAGISISPLDSECGIELLKNADIAMYFNKANKFNGVCRFNQKMADDYQQRLQLELDLKKALENNQFTLVYQPKVCTLSGQVKSVEALLRWSHPERGFVSPAQFIPIAEDTGLMGSIGQWVLNEACREIALVRRNSLPQLKVAVNISAQQFCDEQFVEHVFEALSTHGLNHDSLELEVTESLVMTDVGRVISLLKILKDSGITIAIDDFGTGYSSLQYLQELPLNTLKIDRAFITALDYCDPANSVANSIVQLAKLFNLETVAEGVETDEQDLKIRSLGVHSIQGYLYSKPVPACNLLVEVQNIREQLDWQSSFERQRSA